MRHLLTVLICLALTAAGGTCASGLLGGGSVTPAADAAITASRQINALTLAPDGTLWAATAGGVLRRATGGQWRKWTRRDGLPSHEAMDIALDGDTVRVAFPRHRALWRGERWEVEPAKVEPPREGDLCRIVWQGRPVAATLGGVRIGEGKSGRELPLPEGKGTHISALLPRGDMFWAALYGDGLWSCDGKAWRRVEIALPPEAREITALAAQGSDLWLGTRRDGVWRHDGVRWTRHLLPAEPYEHNGQALAVYQGSLYMSTLEDGLSVLSRKGWSRTGREALSSDAPRQFIVFDGCLYLRHGNGRIDRFDGARWTLDWAKDLPRKQASAIAADSNRLYVAQWGGWSEWDGRAWSHHLTHPELQGTPITALLPAGGALWIGTQGRGLAEVERASGTLIWHDERAGLPDDWVTALARDGDRILAGTFVGGLAVSDEGTWRTVPELAGQNVTALDRCGDGSLAVATRFGVWLRAPSGKLRPLSETAPFVDGEAQALCAVKGGLWIATRTGLFFVRDRQA